MNEQVQMKVDQETADIIEVIVDRLVEALDEACGGREGPPWAKALCADQRQALARLGKVVTSVEMTKATTPLARVAAIEAKLDALQQLSTAQQGRLQSIVDSSAELATATAPLARIAEMDAKLNALQQQGTEQRKQIKSLTDTSAELVTATAPLARIAEVEAKLDALQQQSTAQQGRLQSIVDSSAELATATAPLARIAEVEAKLDALQQQGAEQHSQSQRLIALAEQQQEHIEVQQTALTALARPWWRRLFGA